MPYLFNYGSNNLKQLVKRIGKVSETKPGYIENYMRVYGGFSNFWKSSVATLIEKKNSKVYGFIAKVSEKQLDKMDSYEGVSKNIYKRNKILVSVGQDEIECIVYLRQGSENSMKNKFQYVSKKYLQAVKECIEEFWNIKKNDKLDIRDMEGKLVEKIYFKHIELPSILRRKELKSLCKKNKLSYGGTNYILFNRLCKNKIIEEDDYKDIIIKIVRNKPIYIYILKIDIKNPNKFLIRQSLKIMIGDKKTKKTNQQMFEKLSKKKTYNIRENEWIKQTIILNKPYKLLVPVGKNIKNKTIKKNKLKNIVYGSIYYKKDLN